MQPLIDATKICNVCKEEKPLKDFHPNKECRLGVTGTCRSCNRDRINKWYKNNRRKRQEAANTRNRDKKQMAVDFFNNRCADCGQSFPNYVYQFHHLDPKEKDVNPSYAIARSEERMWKELEKCVMLCANCHLIRHHRKEG